MIYPFARRADLLITGFGPFPTVTHNASGDLAHAIALSIRKRSAEDGVVGPTVVARTLPTAWQSARKQMTRAVTRERPRAVLCFGVSRRATGFCIETVARNVANAVDAYGAEPTSAHLHDDGRRAMHTRVPARKMVQALRARGLPATRSFNAGAYLCNAILYDLLERQRERSPNAPTAVAFVHVPARLLDKTIQGVPHRLEWAQAIDGGLLIADEMMAHATRHAVPTEPATLMSDNELARGMLASR